MSKPEAGQADDKGEEPTDDVTSDDAAAEETPAEEAPAKKTATKKPATKKDGAKAVPPAAKKAAKSSKAEARAQDRAIKNAMKGKDARLDPVAGPLLTPRFLLAIALVVLGIAWIVFYYLQVRVDPTTIPVPKPGKPGFMADLENWNYVIGFGAILLGLGVAAHPRTPLGRGRGVVVGMLGCFLIGLIWICTFYVVSDDPTKVPVMGDLGQYNLLVGIGFMAVGFTYATRWA